MFNKNKRETRVVVEEIDSPYTHRDNDIFRLIKTSLDRENNFYVEKEEFFNNSDSLISSGVFGDEVVFALSSRQAKTVETSFLVQRNNPSLSITEGELEHLIFKALWEFLNKYRKWAFTSLGISDFDLVLANIRVIDVEIDGHSVIQPLGLKGESFRVVLRGTFVSRGSLDLINKVNKMGGRCEVVERFSGASSLLEEDSIVVHVEGDQTSVFSRKDELRLVDTHSKGMNPVLEFISQNFLVSPKEALKMFSLYCVGNMSNRLRKEIKEKADEYFKDIREILRKINYNNSFIAINIPDFVYPHVKKGKKRIAFLNYKKILEERGFHVIMDNRNNRSIHNEFFVLAGISLFMPRYEMMNEMINRRAGWLVPTE